MKSLSPYGKDYLDGKPGSHSLNVVIGPHGWAFAKSWVALKHSPKIILVLRPNEDPKDFRWPVHPYGALIYERGQYCDEQLRALATALLEAGNPFVVALREALIDTGRPDVYFYPEVTYDAA